MRQRLNRTADVRYVRLWLKYQRYGLSSDAAMCAAARRMGWQKHEHELHRLMLQRWIGRLIPGLRWMRIEFNSALMRWANEAARLIDDLGALILEADNA